MDFPGGPESRVSRPYCRENRYQRTAPFDAPRMTLNRIVIGCLAIIGITWVAAYIVDLHDRADDRVFYAQSIAPNVKSGTAFAHDGPMNQWFERLNRRRENALLRMDLFFGAMALFMAWTAAVLIKSVAFWKKRNDPHRSAEPDAGTAIAELRSMGGILTARSGQGWHLFRSAPREVEVNAATETVMFRGFKFITSFIGNRRTTNLTLRFGDILGGRVWVNHGHFSLSLRTTAGTVTITDAVQPFHEVASVLLDAAEVNRATPDRYLEALAREPRIKTPWYGWLIFAVGLGGVAGLAFILWNLPAK